MSSVDPTTVFTAITTAISVAGFGGGAWLYLKKARQAEVDKAVNDALDKQAMENRLRELEGRPLDEQ